MADQSDVTLAIWNALTYVDEPASWRDAPVVDMWNLVASPDEKEVGLVGLVTGSGPRLRSAPLRAVDPARQFAMTEDKIYRLGWPEKVTQEPDAVCIWPPALCVAACPAWQVAVVDAVHFAGEHTLPPELLRDLSTAAQSDVDWPSRWAPCRAIAEHLHGAGRTAVSEAWCLLATDLRSEKDRRSGAIFVTIARDRAIGMYERGLTVDETLAEDGWRLLGAMDAVQIGKLQSDGFPIGDPIAAANKVGLNAILRPTRIPQKIDLGQEPADPGPAGGVIVMRSVGGAETDKLAAVTKVFASILNKRVPVTPVPDLAAARRTLVAEFPYAAGAIDVMLSDLVGRASVKLMPSLVCGPAGNGKSRLARRVGEVLGLHIARYDASQSADNAFGGTPRRWWSGEPAVPVMALIAAKRGDAMVLIDELEKSGSSAHNGRLWDSLLTFSETETSSRFNDPYGQSEVDCSRISYLATCNDELLLPGPLRDRFRLLRIPAPSVEDLPALCRGVVADLIRESGADRAWMPDLSAEEIDSVVAPLWRGGSVRRLRDIVARLIVRRADMPRH